MKKIGSTPWCNGSTLQNLARCLTFYAPMAELVDAPDSKSGLRV